MFFVNFPASNANNNLMGPLFMQISDKDIPIIYHFL